jgi:hypothetical protein
MEIVMLVVQLAIAVLTIAGFWKIFVKAGQPGWACIVPIYNIYIMTQIAGKPAWWIVLFLIPIVSIVAAILVFIAIAQKFGKSAGFGVGMAILPFIFGPMLGFGDAQYNASA